MLTGKQVLNLNIEDIVAKTQNGRIVLDPYWQRDVVWGQKKKGTRFDIVGFMASRKSTLIWQGKFANQLTHCRTSSEGRR